MEYEKTSGKGREEYSFWMDLYTDEEHRKGDVVDDAGFELVNEAANSCMPELHYTRELVARWGD